VGSSRRTRLEARSDKEMPMSEDTRVSGIADVYALTAERRRGEESPGRRGGSMRPGDLLTYRRPSGLRVLARVLRTAPGSAAVELVGSGERVLLTGWTLRAAVVAECGRMWPNRTRQA